MVSERTARQLLKQLEQDKADLRQSLKDMQSNKKIPCAKCNSRQRIRDTTLINVQYYVEPYSCTGGDYWAHAEYNFVCNKCEIRNRFLFNCKYKMEWKHRGKLNFENYFFREYADLFKECVLTHRERCGDSEPFVNNYYVENNIKKFISPEHYQDVIQYFSDQYVTITKKVKEVNGAKR